MLLANLCAIVPTVGTLSAPDDAINDVDKKNL